MAVSVGRMFQSTIVQGGGREGEGRRGGGGGVEVISSVVWDSVFMYFSRAPTESGQLVTSLLQSTIVQRKGKGGGVGGG